MNNFIFQNHTRIYFGKGVVKNYLSKLLEPYGLHSRGRFGGNNASILLLAYALCH